MSDEPRPDAVSIASPDGRVLWDDRLHQDYEARMSSDACPGYIDIAPLASWGPF